MALHWNDPVTAVRGIGEKKASLYRRLGITRVEELVRHLPRDYIDLTRVCDLAESVMGERQLVRAEIVGKSGEQRIRKGFSIFKVEAGADGLRLTITFYNARYAAETLRIGQSYLLYGEVKGTLLHREMESPMVIDSARAGEFLPIYPACAGLPSKTIARDIEAALSSLDGPIPEILPGDLLQQQALPTLDWALRHAHRPRNLAECGKARDRIAFEELLIFSAAMLRLRGARDLRRTEPIGPVSLAPFLGVLPFLPTAGQRGAIEEIFSDLSSGRVMNRLVQGDVGSGKTLVAAAAAYAVWKGGLQSAMMAPTELLAEQHLRTMREFLAPLGMRVELLTGSVKAAGRREIERRLEAGEIDLIVGTHALLTGTTRFSSLGLVITDEQHRFGVAQRSALSSKGRAVHTLVMSATPIPRTLSLILYGDLDISLIRELPPGRTPVSTYCIDSKKRERAFRFVRDRLDEGRQAYLVCPLVEEAGEETPGTGGLISAVEYARRLGEGAFRGYSVGLLHGRLRPAEKEAVMARFLSGEIQLLVATTVVEVGVDVPNATVMMIENAERFGLSQLHQLRGRVGRGRYPSSCILITDAKGQTAAERLRAIKGTNDGFRIAEEDLRLRGPGDLLGLRQHGVPGLEYADFSAGAPLLEAAQRAAAALLREDPALDAPQHIPLSQAVARLIGQVGERPN